MKKFSTPSKFVFVLSAFLFVFACGNNENSSMSSEINEFPSIQGNNLNKVKKIVPDDFVDRDLIVIVAFQQWHQP